MHNSEKKTPIIVFADDLTGAMEVGLQSLPALVLNNPKSSLVPFAKRGVRGDFTDKTLVINTRTRELTSEATYQITKEKAQILHLPESSVKYYKIDSTMRANIGAGVKALQEILQSDLTLIAPALPQNGRITQNGVHYVIEDKSAIKVHETKYGVDIVTPVPTSYIPDIMEYQMGEPIELIELDAIRRGGGYIKKLLGGLPRGKTVVCDATETIDLNEIARAIVSYGGESSQRIAKIQFSQSMLSVGSAGLFQELCRVLGREAETPERTDLKKFYRDGGVVVLAGSLNPRTISQIETAVAILGERIEVLELDVNRLIVSDDEKLEEVKRLQKGIKTTLREGRHVIVRSRPPLLEGEGGDIVAESLGKSIKDDEIMRRLSLLVLTGGETAIHVTEELGACGIEVKGSLEPFVPVGTLIGGEYENTMVITKAGGFGSQEVIADIIKAKANTGLKI